MSQTRRVCSFSLEEICVRPCPDEAQFAAFDAIYQQPVRFDMALPAVFQRAFQPVVSGFRRRFFSGNQQLYDGFELLYIFMALFQSLDISFELRVATNGPHGLYPQVIVQIRGGGKALSFTLP